MENGTKIKSQKDRASVFFVLATVCAFPFALELCLAAVGLFAHSKLTADAFLFSAFLLPGLLLLAVSGFVFIVLAWARENRGYRPFLVLYGIIIAAYWKAMSIFGPW